MPDTATPTPTPEPRPGRHLAAVGIIRHTGGRTLTLRATPAGVTGTITSAVTR
ncbi:MULTISPECIES: hypothetical protein [unclassified Streptomyces]|uniref:hypothetical protein n=1 Tax=unclassified Streptomyces TaxID=2593676 RepID=UPI00226FA52D|nr:MULTISPECIES: hypothetical protein [unclassified Streptomyces]MCY0921857.1 hypothetical protein [Streptomyces sp. H27-G5]MCY0957193.1 hypothetical protein [Streptomyces sp. H27-H5]